MISRSFLIALALFALAIPSRIVAADAKEGGTNQFYVLGIYDVEPGDMAKLETIFRTGFKPLAIKHGLTPVGYWTAKGEDGMDKFINLTTAANGPAFQAAFEKLSDDEEFKAQVSKLDEASGNLIQGSTYIPMNVVDWAPAIRPEAASDARVFELRVYDVMPGKMKPYLANYKERRLKLFEKHGFKNLGFWRGEGEKEDTFVMLLSHKTPQLVEDSKKAYHADPEWKAGVDDWNKQVGKTTNGVDSYTMKPTDFSPWK